MATPPNSRQMSNCKTCVHWHNKQRELNYWHTTGFCLCPAMNFTVANGKPLGVIDRCNEKDRQLISGNPSHDIETMTEAHVINASRYSIATQEDFGCVFHKQRKNK